MSEKLIIFSVFPSFQSFFGYRSYTKATELRDNIKSVSIMAYTSNAVWFTVDKSEKLQIAKIKQIALKWQLKSTPENKPLNNIDVIMPL